MDGSSGAVIVAIIVVILLAVWSRERHV